MRPEVEAAHMRMLSALPVRTVRARRAIELEIRERAALDAQARGNLLKGKVRIGRVVIGAALSLKGPNGCCDIVTLAGGEKVKRCSGCKQQKPVSMFTKGSGPGGLHRHCKNCCRAAHRGLQE